MDANSIIASGIVSRNENNFGFDNRIPQLLIDIQNSLGESCELLLGNWVIMSLNEVTEYNEELEKHYINHIYNFAYSNRGMGWLYVAAVDLNNGKVFVRQEGGSSGYDVEANLKKSIDFIVNNKIDKYLNLEEFFELLQHYDNSTTDKKTLSYII